MACKSCGMEGVDGICSMCYGDPWHNTDGEYLRQLYQAQREMLEEAQREMLEEAQREQYDEVGRE